jgi:hypothetical protein
VKYLFMLVIAGFSINLAWAQDSDFIRARKYLDQLDNGIRHLKTNDVNTYNDLSAGFNSLEGL